MQHLDIIKAKLPALESVWPSKDNYKVYAYAGGAVVAYFAVKAITFQAFPFVLSKVMVRMHNAVTVKKENFEEAFSKIETEHSKDGKLEILEIGIGTGCNFRFFPKNANLTILDKSDYFLKYLKQSIENENRQDLTVSKLVINPGEDMKDIPSNSMDAVVHTFITCSVDEPKLVFQEIYRVLKPGGVSIFIEHSLDDDSLWHRIIQKIVQSTGIFQECKFLSMKKLFESSYKVEGLHLQRFKMAPKYLLPFNPIVYGYAIKKH